MPREIERKFLIDKPPADYDRYPNKEIIQGYIVITDGMEVRIRKKGKDYFQTIKTGRGLVREETEIEITRDQFNKLWKLTENRRIEKRRYEIEYEGVLIELDFYGGILDSLIVAEVEFGSDSQSAAFSPPEWFGREITEDEKFKNKQLALQGTAGLNLKGSGRL